MNKLITMLLASSMLWVTSVVASPVVTFEPSCRPHIIHSYEEVSRDYSYLEFQRNKQPCHLQGIIGGEHQTYIKVLAFAGERYSVSLKPLVDLPSFSVSGEGIEVSHSDDYLQQIVTVIGEQTFFSIEMYAYPYGKYEMVIERLMD